MRSGEMAGIHYLSRKEQHPDNQPPIELTNDSSFSYNLARRLPHVLKERTLNLGEIDKIFASQWLTENEVVVGTKCNKLIVLDTTTGRKLEIPKLQNAKTPCHKNPCGIHCVCVSQDHRFLATGGNNPNDLAVYSLPTMDPVIVGESHTDWIFNIQWITDSLLITGSRDSTMALWSISEDSYNRRCIAEDVPVMKPIFRFPNILRDHNHTAGERVRSLAYNSHGYLQRASSLGGVNKENSPLKSLNRSVNECGAVRKRTAGIALGEQENCPSALTPKKVEPTKNSLCSPSTKKFRSSGLSEVSFNVHRNISKKEKLSAGQVDFPLDLSLKSKARFTSLHPFTWTASVKTHQEANGISKFVRSQSSAEESGGDACSEFQRNLMVWVHPSLPFMKLFPRMETKVSSVGQQFSWLPDQQLLNSLKEDWDTSFRSLFQLLTMGHCPYFYLCANHFTVLFIYAGVMGCAHITALLSPTTSGFRQALKKGGVDFTLPLASGAQPKAEGTSNGILEDSENEDESAASTWLCSLGIATQDFPAANMQQITFQRSSPVNIDNHPESVVRVEASNVHALFNFLLTSKTTITTTGAHAGIPPTLVAPVAYEGGTLKSLTARQGTVHEHVGGKMMQFHSLDISGPILPEALCNLSCLFQQTQHSNFTVYTTSVVSTGSFNAASMKPSTLPPPSSPTTSKFNHYLTLKPISQKSGLKEVSCKNGCYTWN